MTALGGVGGEALFRTRADLYRLQTTEAVSRGLVFHLDSIAESINL